jgi:prohibitin 2
MNNSLGLKLTSALIGIGMLFGVLIIMDGFVSVGPGEVGVIFDRGKGVLSRYLPEGLHLKIPFWQVVDTYSVRTQEYSMIGSISESALRSDGSINARSRDGQTVMLDATVLFHLASNDAPYIKQNIGNEKDYMRIIVQPKARSIIREIVAKYDALDLVSEKRNLITDEMTKILSDSFKKHKITLDEVVLRDVSFSPEFSSAVEEKQIAFQRVKTAEFKKQEAEQVKQKKIIEAEGDAKAIELKGEALKLNPAVVQLEFVDKLADNIKWGILPNDSLPMIDIKELMN